MGFTNTSPIRSQLDQRETAKLQIEQTCKDAFNRRDAVMGWGRMTRKNNNNSPS